MLVYSGVIEGYNVKIEKYDREYDPYEASAALYIKGKGVEIKSPVFGRVPVVIPEDTVRQVVLSEVG